MSAYPRSPQYSSKSDPYSRPYEGRRPPEPRAPLPLPPSVPAEARIIYGIHAVTELLRNRDSAVYALGLSSPSHASGGARQPATGGPAGLPALAALAAERGIAITEYDRGDLDRLTRGGVHQGVVAFCPAFHYHSDVHALLQAAGEAPPLVVILDGVTDPQNLGALVRSTYVLGGHGVVLPMNHSAQVTAAAVKAAAGATEVLPIAQVANLVRAMRDLKDRQVQLLAAVAPGQGGTPAWDCDLRRPTAILLGSEGRGLKPQVRKSCDGRIEVPMQSGLHGASLNVSAAGAVLLYEALRQRGIPPKQTLQ